MQIYYVDTHNKEKLDGFQVFLETTYMAMQSDIQSRWS